MPRALADMVTAQLAAEGIDETQLDDADYRYVETKMRSVLTGLKARRAWVNHLSPLLASHSTARRGSGAAPAPTTRSRSSPPSPGCSDRARSVQAPSSKCGSARYGAWTPLVPDGPLCRFDHRTYGGPGASAALCRGAPLSSSAWEVFGAVMHVGSPGADPGLRCDCYA
ncbi:hypothetical protein GCM10023353_01420 [Tomitella cavernea]|uniref:Uncharacterized protein n=1 Tax=Tomitella cavernea TaxID=1387982 RepID=A0ABP9C3E1_9ACTN